MKTSRWLGLLFCSLLAMRASAAEWNLVRYESREYVTLEKKRFEPQDRGRPLD